MAGGVRHAERNVRPDYGFDYSTAVRGKYYRRLLKEGSNLVLPEPDVAKEFRNSAAINEVLRSPGKTGESSQRRED